ncbi:hypothetical protein CDAR_296011 [Caerostris darwini]|uniref:Uncharacterized protein n=1 Tax=Caerostris darwini TaxID=1538125 RepID=A0AAV4SS44_9ARAC|nr:hypothetical protein CDAR_296011 [Caerostris darwini]
MCCGNSPPTPFRISRRLFFRKFRHFIPFSKASGDRAAEGLRATNIKPEKKVKKCSADCYLFPSLSIFERMELSLNYSYRIVGLKEYFRFLWVWKRNMFAEILYS